MNILVTGGRGQLGCSINKIAANHPQHNFIFTDMPEADITNHDCMAQLIVENKVNVLINCAAYTAVDKAEDEEELARKINADGAAVLGEVCKEHKVKLVHISTDYVFDGTTIDPINERVKTNPQSAYGRTKLAGEQHIKESGTDAVIVRTAWLYSEFGNNFVKTMLRLAETRDELGVVADQYGTPTYAPDLAEAIMKLIDKGFKGFKIYHYSNEGETSWWEFADTIFQLAGKAITVKPLTTDQYPAKAHRPAFSVLDKSKIKETGVFVPEWEDSLRVCLKELNALAQQD